MTGVLCTVYGAQVFLHLWSDCKIFMPPAWKVRRGHLVFGSSVCLSVRPKFRLAYTQSAIFKVWVVLQLPNLECKFIQGLLTLHWHHMPLGVGRGQNLGLRDFAIFGLCCHRGHPCFTNTCLVPYAKLTPNVIDTGIAMQFSLNNCENYSKWTVRSTFLQNFPPAKLTMLKLYYSIMKQHN